MKRALVEQAEEVGWRLRKEHLAARAVQLKLCYADITTLTRRKTLPTPTQDEMLLYQIAEKLLLAEKPEGQFIRLIGIGGSNLVQPEFQMDLFDKTPEKRARVAKVLDAVRANLGSNAVKRSKAL